MSKDDSLSQPPHDITVQVVRSGFPMRLNIDNAVSSSDGAGFIFGLVVLPLGWIACRLVNIILFQGSWTVGVVTTAKRWSSAKVAFRERYQAKAAAEGRANELETQIANGTLVLPTKEN